VPRASKDKKSPSWAVVKRQLAGSDRADLLGLIGDLYAASPDNRAFLSAHLGLGEDPLAPFKAIVEHGMYPDVIRGHQPSIQKAKKAITDYRRATADQRGTVDLRVCFCEQASEFALEYGMDDESYLDALVRMFEQAVKGLGQLNAMARAPLAKRLKGVMGRCRDVGYGVGETMQDIWDPP